MILNKFLGKKMVKTDTLHSVITYASFDPEQSTLFIYLINKTEKAEKAKLFIGNYKITSIKQAFEYFGKTSADMNPVWQQKELKNRTRTINLKDLSITVLETKIERKEPHR
jgi:hypothetical protein